MKKNSEKSCRETQNTLLWSLALSLSFFFFNRAVCEIMWKNFVEWGRPEMKIWRMRLACWIPKATNTHTGYAILNAFPLQQWLHASILRLCTLPVLCNFKTGGNMCWPLES